MLVTRVTRAGDLTQNGVVALPVESGFQRLRALPALCLGSQSLILFTESEAQRRLETLRQNCMVSPNSGGD